ncbi:CYTH and CHAD domain-containing protein [Pseudonocardia humida]|uniref:CHAD domain-containing protein n=1 Tax=Pseudonocardia humida TaxID=2800819 RepID=A0ABT1A384_9PSEU|nr:CHAD domain-containing protein [Pseudonocardia humida]MCO1657457.1 CHAD domain-containing protein [Pseudonocardia humida]
MGRPNLAGLPGVHRHDDGEARVLEVERHDTDDRGLAAAGLALTVRRDGDTPHWRLEGAGEPRRVPLAADAPPVPDVPDELAELVRGATRGRTVGPVGRLRTVRTRTVLSADDVDVAEVVHDDITLALLGDTAEVRGWSEVAVRSRGASAEVLDGIEQRLAEIGLRPAPPAGEAELDRLLRPASRSRSTGRKGSAGEAVMRYIAAQADRLAAEELRVRAAEPDSIHQMRVASRRLRSALQAYRPLLDRGRTEPVVDALRDLGRALAPARDAEVLRQGISEQLADLEPELRLGAVEAMVTRHFAREEAETAAAALSALDGERYAWLRSALDDLLERPPLRKRAGRKAGRELPAVLARTGRKLQKAVHRATDAQAPAADRDTATHAARKAGKRLRYATEVARPALGRPAKRFATSLKPLQKALGHHQDAVVAGDALRRLGGQAHTEGENGFSLGLLYARGEARKQRIERELPDLWRRTWTKKTTAFLR